VRGHPTLERPRIQQPTKFELVINLYTAEALGIDVPADPPCACRRVIE
jgi:hypothetical protein